MEKFEKINKIKSASNQLLNCKDDFFYMKQGVDNLYKIFKEISGIDINDLNNGEIMLPSGKAISPSAAAHCLLEMKRTAIFLRGIKKAIDYKVKANKGGVSILYAGCGPYATLITPLLTLYNLNGLKITLLDVNQTSLDAVKRLLTELDLDRFIDEYVLADASTYKITKEYDIVISETMQSCLENEPQVSIMKNLIPQVDEETIFIPEQITIDAYLKKPGNWQKILDGKEKAEVKFLKEIFSVNKDKLDIEKYRAVVKIPAELGGFIDLMLHTTIIVYDDEILAVNDCSLNLPKKFYEFRERYAESIEFWYSLDSQPKIECKVIEFA